MGLNQTFYTTLASDIVNVLCTGIAGKLFAVLPEPWEAQADLQQVVAVVVLVDVGHSRPQADPYPLEGPSPGLSVVHSSPSRLAKLSHISCGDRLRWQIGEET